MRETISQRSLWRSQVRSWEDCAADPLSLEEKIDLKTATICDSWDSDNPMTTPRFVTVWGQEVSITKINRWRIFQFIDKKDFSSVVIHVQLSDGHQGFHILSTVVWYRTADTKFMQINSEGSSGKCDCLSRCIDFETQPRHTWPSVVTGLVQSILNLNGKIASWRKSNTLWNYMQKLQLQLTQVTWTYRSLTI